MTGLPLYATVAVAARYPVKEIVTFLSVFVEGVIAQLPPAQFVELAATPSMSAASNAPVRES